MEDLVKRLREELEMAVERNAASCMLFSGGVDTSILAWFLVRLNTNFRAITVSLGSSGEDILYAWLLVKHLNLNHYHRPVNIDEAIESIPTVVKILKSFDPAIPNDLAVYFGLKTVKELGLKEAMTGDGADELFAGYDYMNPALHQKSVIRNMEDLDEYIKRIASSMSFSSNRLGDFFGIKIRQPYLDREFVDFALHIPVESKVREEKGKIYGKWVLRKALEDVLSKEIAWQSKRPLEYGSGMDKLREIISSRISDKEFWEKKDFYKIDFLNKEHLYFYEIYRKEVGGIPQSKEGQKECPSCKAGVEKNTFHCKVCGYVLRKE
ncbi:MAG: Asparagine synthetase B (glutamine-hydrolyzing) [candidate division WS2 bacterium]|nr:Asparagine synthetase B (glutamine-hydrolyzing) [Candidatus Psychracetigena formicireducens]